MSQLTERNTASETNPKADGVLDYVVIGAGIAGLTAASCLNKAGKAVAVFEKARGTGGRLSSKRVVNTSTTDNDTFMAFDLGSASLVASSTDFAEALEAWHQRGAVALWFKDDSEKIHYVGTPRNSAVTRYLSKDLECHFSTRVTDVEYIDGLWHVFTEGSHSSQGHSSQHHSSQRPQKTLLAISHNVIIAAPPQQAIDLLPNDSTLQNSLSEVKVDPQWVMGVQTDTELANLQCLQYPDSDIIASISLESSKPGRTSGQSSLATINDEKADVVLQVQATAAWTQNHLDLSSEQVSSKLMVELERLTQQPINTLNCYSHRWLYSRIAQSAGIKQGYLWDEKGLGLIGDYINNDYEGIESAWFSGKQLADWLTFNESKEA